jgi:2-keto-4-pentenoate hydratase/2-oxohepta-3-ene-1,7-dioic acid hydratase in catechol pathway
MKLVRYGERGAERPGLVGPGGVLRDLSREVADLSPATLGPEALRRLAAVAADRLPAAPGGSRLGPCVTGVGKFIGVGLNYLDHVRESGAAVPAEPVLFMKATTCIAGPCDPLLLPPQATKVDWEVELGVVIGSVARNVAERDALAHVAGYCVVNDVSERGWQLEGTGQWTKGKSADGFGPVGPWLVTRDEIPDPQKLRLWLSVNGRLRQDSSTGQMIFPVVVLVSYISRFMTLCPGDIIATGTPPGVALGARPPVYLRPGDLVKCGIEGLGEQTLAVAAAAAQDQPVDSPSCR